MEYGLGGTGTGLNRGIGYYSSAQIFDTYGIYGLGGASPPANTFVMEAAALSKTSRVAFPWVPFMGTEPIGEATSQKCWFITISCPC
jgi:hypothetical protein